MCLGGPNHCRVGWRGSQFYLLLIDFLCKESSVVSRVSGPLKAGFPLL
jgi:hypothetical protein